VASTFGDDGRQLAVVESVCCLDCGAVYAKPLAGGTVRENPGCPDCGYVGWMAAASPAFSEDWQPRRSAEGRQLHQSG
jgi:predicted  nucleic acid-binding Zn-ribbon protein